MTISKRAVDVETFYRVLSVNVSTSWHVETFPVKASTWKRFKTFPRVDPRQQMCPTWKRFARARGNRAKRFHVDVETF